MMPSAIRSTTSGVHADGDLIAAQPAVRLGHLRADRAAAEHERPQPPDCAVHPRPPTGAATVRERRRRLRWATAERQRGCPVPASSPREVLERFADALAAQDLDSIMALYEPQAILVAQPGTVSAG